VNHTQASFPARTARQAGTAPAICEVSANPCPHPSPQPSQPHASRGTFPPHGNDLAAMLLSDLNRGPTLCRTRPRPLGGIHRD